MTSLKKPDVVVQVVVLAEDEKIQIMLEQVDNFINKIFLIDPLMINSTLTLNNFFDLRLRDPNLFDSENLNVGNSFNLKKWIQLPSDPQWG